MTSVSAPGPAEDVQRARLLVLRFGWNSMAYQILNPGISLWFSPEASAVVGYVAAAGYRVVAGAPVCATEALGAVASAFEADTRRAGQRVCYFGAQERFESLLAARGYGARILLGAQPTWHPGRWEQIVRRKSSLRAQLLRARNKQVQAVAWPAQRATNHPALRSCLEAWLATRGLPPLHFLVEPDILGRLEDRKIFVAERAGEVVGFLIASPVPLRNGWLIEQVIRSRAAPNGTNELLVDAAMRNLAEAGAEYVTLGLSPLSQRADISPLEQPLWLRLLLAWVRAHGRRFYNFNGLDAFKAKFLPERWEPIYAVAEGQRMPPSALYAIAGAFSGASPVLFVGQALRRALSQELVTVRRRVGQWAGLE